MNQRLFRQLSLGIFILALAVIVSGCIKKPVVTNQNQNVNVNTNAATSTTDTIDTSNWKTYRNEQYGFEVKYPEFLSIQCTNDIFCHLDENDKRMIEMSSVSNLSRNNVQFPLFAEEAAKYFCGAGGPHGSIECPRILTNKDLDGSDLKGRMITLEEVISDYLNNSTATIIKGPVYVLELPRVIGSDRGLYFELSNNVPVDRYNYYEKILLNIVGTTRSIQ